MKLACFALIGLTGCVVVTSRPANKPVYLPTTARTPGDEREARPELGDIRQTSMSRKRVKAKQDPSTLIADDDMRCVVNDKRFKDTDVGDWALCPWTY